MTRHAVKARPARFPGAWRTSFRRAADWQRIMHKSFAYVLTSVVLGSFAASTVHGAEPSAPMSVDLLAELQPLRPRVDSPADLAPRLRPIAALAQKGKWQPACLASEALRSNLLRQAARLFYAPDRAKGADVAGIDRFLNVYVRGRTPLLEVPADVFAPAASWRAIAVDACVRANRGDLAVLFVAEAAGAARAGSLEGSAARVAMAVAMAQRAGRWQAALSVLATEDSGVRALLLRALATAEVKTRNRFLDEARRSVTRPDELRLIAKVEALLRADRAPPNPALGGRTP